jgi:hypothetical protein
MMRLWYHWGVLVIVGVLLVSIVGVRIFEDRYRRLNETQATINLLEMGCKVYQLDYGVFPPGDPTFDSRILHRCLGRTRTINKSNGSELMKPPILEFTSEMLLDHPKSFSADNPLPIVDAWNRPIRYANPGRHKAGGVDLWSYGRNGKEEPDPTAPDFDDVTNWTRDSVETKPK